MARSFYSSGKKTRKQTSRRSSEELSETIEAWPFSQKAVLFFGAFFLFLFLGVILAGFLNPETVYYLARVGRLPRIGF